MPSPQIPELIGQSAVFLDALAQASAVAPFDRPVLIIGERGSGKELIAERIHFLSTRWDKPLLKVNCAALSEDLLDSELFGHEAGAFTGARSRHQGRFERAAGGTLFLDEIASASLRVQEKLLRVIEYGEFERLGGEATQAADVRILAAANIDLQSLAAAGKFRADLLDRLAFDVISAPPLRRRKEDIPLLASYFASRFAGESFVGGDFPGFSDAALATLSAYDWPGNVRELKNAAERSLYRWIAGGGAGPVDAVVIDPFGSGGNSAPAVVETRRPDDRPDATEPYDFRARLDRIERTMAIEALAANQWSQRRTAAFLGLTYDQMRGLVRKHRLRSAA